MPDGKGLDAGGTYSGLRSRGGSIAPLPMVRVQAAFVQQGIAISDPHAPPAFYVVSYGGKCLDFGPPPQVSGAPVFIYGCNGTISQQVQVQEINDRHEVILRAGTKVIGVKRSTQPPAAVSRAVEPIVRDHRGETLLPAAVPPPPVPAPPSTGAIVQDSRGNATLSTPPLVMVPVAPPSSPGELLLELQDESNRQAKISALALASASASGQVFALDGDSIILASDHTSVVKVLNNRGANRTPLVLGSRELADNEFWTFQAADRSGRYPTAGFVHVSQTQDFVRQAQQAKPGTIIDVDPGASIDLTNSPQLAIPEGVTIRGNRRGTSMGPEIHTSQYEINMFQIRSRDVRITGLRLRGPSRSTDETPGATGIYIQENLITGSVLIDHNDMSDWPGEAVNVDGGDPSKTCSPLRPPGNVHIVRNFIHHNERQNDGYGVETQNGGYSFIEGNTFVSNRHAIAAGGQANTVYRARQNLVLQDTPVQHKDGASWHTQDFDVHGTGDGGFGGTAGQYFEIAQNTFLGTKTGVTWTVVPIPFSPGTTHPNFHIRGTPCFRAEYHDNVSREKPETAINNDGDTPMLIANNLFESIDPTTRLGVGDFDGDGFDDVFLATGAAWYYAPQANAEWHFLNAQPDPIGNLLFGDFDGDGRTDVFTQHGRDWVVSWGGASAWDKINESNPALSEFRIGDFNGDRLSDVFYADGTQWYVSYGGNTPFTPAASSSFRAHDLGFGDFNGDGKTDVVAATSGQWMVSLSATGPWAGWPLRPALTNTMAGLIIADFNGNGRADIASFTGRVMDSSIVTQFISWEVKVSWDGTGNWTPLRTFTGSLAAVGRFDATRGADILFFPSNANYFVIQSSGNGAPVRQSRQDMR
jgi:hypothetical protein